MSSNIQYKEIGYVEHIEEEYEKYIRRKKNYIKKINDEDLNLYKSKLKKKIDIKEIYLFSKDNFYEDIKIIQGNDGKYMKTKGKFFNISGYFIFEPNRSFNHFAYSKKFPERKGYIKYNDILIYYTYDGSIFNIDSLHNIEVPKQEIEVELIFCKDFRFSTEIYFNKYKDKFMEFKYYGFDINEKFEKYNLFSLEQYIQHNYIGCNKFLNEIRYNDLIKNKIIPKYDFEKIKFHDEIDINLDQYIENYKIKGTLIDYAIKKIINSDSICPISYLKTCKVYNQFPEKLKNLSDEDLYNEIFSTDFNQKVEEIKKFKNLTIGKFSYNHKLKIYGIPDIHTNNKLFDIKNSSKDPINSKNYLQLLFYSLLFSKDIKEIYIYEPLKGFLYRMIISNINKTNFKNKIANLDFKK